MSSESTKPVCRACLKTSFRLKQVTSVDKKLSMTIRTSYSLLTGINCSENDQICPKCLKMLVKCSKFIEKCEEADAKLIETSGETETDTEFYDESTTTVSQEPEATTTDQTDQSFEEIQNDHIEEEISSVCSDAGSEPHSGDTSSTKIMETQAQVHSGPSSGKSVKFHDKLEEVYESDFEECSSETDGSSRATMCTMNKRGKKRPRLGRRPKKANKNDMNILYFCRVCRK